jgi:hypothetical protein
VSDAVEARTTWTASTVRCVQRVVRLWLTVGAEDWPLAWSALDAANKGPLHTATVAAIAHRIPAATALPL